MLRMMESGNDVSFRIYQNMVNKHKMIKLL